MEALIAWLRHAPLWQAVLVLLAENVVVLPFALALGEWLGRLPAEAPGRQQA